MSFKFSALFFQKTGNLENIDPLRNVKSFSSNSRLLFTNVSLEICAFFPYLCTLAHASTWREERTLQLVINNVDYSDARVQHDEKNEKRRGGARERDALRALLRGKMGRRLSRRVCGILKWLLSAFTCGFRNVFQRFRLVTDLLLGQNHPLLSHTSRLLFNSVSLVLHRRHLEDFSAWMLSQLITHFGLHTLFHPSWGR